MRHPTRPLVLLMLTGFVKISVVLSLLRNAIGALDAPSSLVVLGMSLVLTAFVMAPVASDMVRAAAAGSGGGSGDGSPGPDRAGTAGQRGGGSGAAVGSGGGAGTPAAAVGSGGGPGTPAAVGERGRGAGQGDASQPGQRGTRAAPAAAAGGATVGWPQLRAAVPAEYRAEVDAVARAAGPLREFLRRHTAERDRTAFAALARELGHAVDGDELWVLAPAFLSSELRAAFTIAVLVFLPFLVIDLIVGLGLAALGLSATSPQTVALPLKLLLFVAVDGWRLLLESLLRGYV